MKSWYLSIILVAVFIAGCGGGGQVYDPSVPTQVDPYINRINPAAASGGDTVTIFGRGFSDVPDLNVVITDGAEALANSYSLVTPATSDEIESLTFVVPAGIAAGPHSIYVYVLGNVSNTNVSITIN